MSCYGELILGVELISTLLGKVLLGYEHNYIVHAFLYATEKSQGSHTKDWRRVSQGEENPIFNTFNAFNSPPPKSQTFTRIISLNLLGQGFNLFQRWIRLRYGTRATRARATTKPKIQTGG